MCENNIIETKSVLILLSTYNGSESIKRQIDSILNQTVINKIDVLIRDDGSTDDTVSILKVYSEKYRFIKLIQGTNVGVNASYFELIRLASCNYDFYGFSDQDDIWFPDKIEIALNELTKKKSDIPLLYGSCSLVVNEDLKGDITTQKNIRGVNEYNVLIQNIFPGHSQVINLKLLCMLRKVSNTEKIFFYDWWSTQTCAFFGEILSDNNPHTYYIQHSNNVIGYGNSLYSWVIERLRRVNNGDAKKYTIQNKFFLKTYDSLLSIKQKKVLIDFINSQSSLTKRVSYISKKNIYRQKKLETILMKIMFLLGKYK